jgi:hypothetical protein
MRIGPFPDWDDPEDIRWGLLPNAVMRGIASLIRGYDPVTARYERKLAKESRENFERLSALEHEAYDNLEAHYHRDKDTGTAEQP